MIRVVHYSCRRCYSSYIKRNVYRHTDSEDFPENVRAVLGSGLHKHLLSRAEAIGVHFHNLIRSLLEVQAFINLRKVQGLITIAQREDRDAVNQAAAFILEHRLQVHPKAFRDLLAKLRVQNDQSQTLPLSQETLSFVRDASYFMHTQETHQ